jgi:hypothetical protein
MYFSTYFPLQDFMSLSSFTVIKERVKDRVGIKVPYRSAFDESQGEAGVIWRQGG